MTQEHVYEEAKDRLATSPMQPSEKNLAAGLLSNESPNACQYLIAALRDEGASHIFMVPGGFVDNFSQALVDVDGIQPIVTASEGGAAMMADGFARASGRFGICMGIAGPGVSNMLTALSAAMVDQIPVLVISGDTPLTWRNRDAIQDSGSQGLNSLELLRTICKKQYQVSHPNLLPDYVRRSTAILTSSQPEPVHISIPLDIQKQSVSVRAPVRKHVHNRVKDTAGLDSVLRALISTKKTAILIGAGVRKSQAFNSIKRFAERFQVPVATTMSAKGDLPENHPLSLGVFGWAGTALANETFIPDRVEPNAIECLIVIGSKLGQIATMGWSKEFVENRTLIHIDISPAHFNQNYEADLSVQCDARTALDHLACVEIGSSDQTQLEEMRLARNTWVDSLRNQVVWHYDIHDTVSNTVPIHPARAITDLQRAAPKNTQICVDNGAHTFFTTHYWNAQLPDRFFNIIKYSGAMGWAIAASVGAKLARPDLPTIAVTGDGCMLMHGMEIQTAARYKLKQMVFVVLNNQAHGNPKLRAEGFTDDAATLTDIVDHDWAKFADSLGVRGFSVSEPSQLLSVFKQALRLDTPALIDVKCGLYPTPTKIFDQTFMQQFNEFLEHKNS